MKARLLDALLHWMPSLEGLVFDHVARHQLAHRIHGHPQLRGRISTIYDIGANRGDWTRMATKMLPASKFFLFEANEVHRPDLQRLDHPFFIGVLANSRREVEFFGDGGTGDSYYCENTIHYDAVAPRIELTHTLDEVIEKHDVPMPDFIKLDTQGAELDILRGGTRAPAHAKLVFLECPILAYNAGAPGI